MSDNNMKGDERIALVEAQPLPEKNHNSTTVVRIVAPCDLPPNYMLLVEDDAVGNENGTTTTYEVLVPEGGVKANEVFEATKRQPRPIEGMFADGLFNCGNERDFWCPIVCCFRGIGIAALMEKLELNWCGNHHASKKHTFVIVASLTMVVAFLNLCSLFQVIPDSIFSGNFPLILSLYFITIWTKTRMAFRSKYKIPGSCFFDCLTMNFCSCCASLQMYRHMCYSGDRPKRFVMNVGKPAAAPTVVKPGTIQIV